MKYIDGPVELGNLSLKEIPSQLKGITINGRFNIGQNSLISLKNSPEIINGDFFCTYNKRLTSLIGGPKQVRSIYTHFCNLSNLDGLPELINKGYQAGSIKLDLSYNRLVSLQGMPERVNGSVYIDNNPTLTSLRGCTQTITGDFIANEIPIKTLEGGPKTVNGSVQLVGTKLENLDGLPTYIGGYLLVGDTPIGKKLFPEGQMTQNQFDAANNLFKEINSKSKILLGIYEFEEDAEEELANDYGEDNEDDGYYPEYEDEER